MPATTLTPLTIPARHTVAGAALTWTACDSVNGNEVAASDTLLLLFRNTDGSAQTVNITSVADPIYGRTGNVAYSLASGAFRMFQMTKVGWQDANGKIAFSSHANVYVAAIIIQ